jgi:hypothetical protein
MANSPQAKKRARQNEARFQSQQSAPFAHPHVSPPRRGSHRIRRSDGGGKRAPRRATRADARCHEGCVAQEHGRAENVASEHAREGDVILTGVNFALVLKASGCGRLFFP